MVKRFLWVGLLLAFAGQALASEGVLSVRATRDFNRGGADCAFRFFNVAAGDTAGVHSTFSTSLDSSVVRHFTAAEIALLTAGSTYGRNVTVTVSGTDANVNAGTITVTGKNCLDDTITEDYTISENTPAVKTGAKAFAKLTKVVINQQDGTEVYVSIGFGVLLGLPFTSPLNSVLSVWTDGTKETTAPTVAFDTTDIEKNTISTNTAPNGTRDFTVLMWMSPFKINTAPETE